MRNLIDRWNRFRSLDRREKVLLLQALALLPATGLGLRLFGLRRCQAVLARISPVARTERLPLNVLPSRIHSTARLVETAGLHVPYHATCLRRSLVLWYLLRRQGIQSELRIGVRKTHSDFEAHAWIEHLRLVLNDAEDVRQRYVPFDRPIGPSTTDAP